jgi:hypothetical protein
MSNDYQDEDLSLQEKTVTKCICRVLNGFHFEEVPDALEGFIAQGDAITGEVG